MFCIGLSGPFPYLSRRAGSVGAAGLAHATLNNTAVIPLIVIVGGTDLTLGVTSLVGLGLLLAANLALAPMVRRHADALTWE